MLGNASNSVDNIPLLDHAVRALFDIVNPNKTARQNARLWHCGIPWFWQPGAPAPCLKLLKILREWPQKRTARRERPCKFPC